MIAEFKTHDHGGTSKMMSERLHPWLNTAEAVDAARKAVQIPLALLPAVANAVGRDELESEALAILTECALPRREDVRLVCAREGCGTSLADVRKGAKFCGQKCRRQHGMDVLRSKDGTDRPRGFSAAVLESGPQSHVGSMHDWPEDERGKYAVRIVGYALNNWLRTRRLGREIASSDALANMNVLVPTPEENPYEFLTGWLEEHGITVSGDETFTELAEAAEHVRAVSGRPYQIAA
jgi:hypothetical protein